MAVDTLGHIFALHVTPANTDDRAEVGQLLEAAQEATQRQEGEAAAEEHGVELVIIRLPEAKKGFVLLPARWSRSARLDNALPPSGQGLQALCQHAGRIALRCLRLPHVEKSSFTDKQFMTPSNKACCAIEVL